MIHAEICNTYPDGLDATMTTYYGRCMTNCTAKTDTNPIAQLEICMASWRNRMAALIGSIGGLVPYGAYRLGHYEITSWSPFACPKALVVYAALAFSVLTVSGWAHQVFATANRWESLIKALGFTALVEALMMTSDYRPLALGCLGLLIAINAVANGCRLAVRAAETGATPAELAAVRSSRKTRKSPPRLRAVA